MGYKSTTSQGDGKTLLVVGAPLVRRNVVTEMVIEKVITMMSPSEKPWVVSPFGAVPERGTDKFRLTVNMRYVNRHLGLKAFNFEGLKDLADLAERRDHAVSYDLMSRYYHVGLHPRSRIFDGLKWEGQ